MYYFDFENRRVYRDSEPIIFPADKYKHANSPRAWEMVQILASQPDGARIGYDRFKAYGSTHEMIQRPIREFLEAIGDNTRPHIFQSERGFGYRVNKKGRFCVLEDGSSFPPASTREIIPQSIPSQGFQIPCLTQLNTSSGTEEEFEFIDINAELASISRQMDMLVEKLERLQEKIDHAKDENSIVWEQIYSAQFQTTFSLIMSLRRETEEKRAKLENLLWSRSDAAPVRPDGVFAFTFDPMMLVKTDLCDLKNWMDSSAAQVDCIESLLDEAICAYLSSDSCDADCLETVLPELPLNRDTALALYRLTASFDGMLELYEALFDQYAAFLTDDERRQLLDRAKKVWEPVIWKSWE